LNKSKGTGTILRKYNQYLSQKIFKIPKFDKKKQKGPKKFCVKSCIKKKNEELN